MGWLATPLHASITDHDPSHAHAAETHAPTQHHYTTTGFDNRKVAIWMFIGSECMLFASLISTYLIYKGKNLVGPLPHEAWTNPQTGQTFPAILNIPVTSISTFVLLMSSFAMVMALAAIENRDQAEARQPGLLVEGREQLEALAAHDLPHGRDVPWLPGV